MSECYGCGDTVTECGECMFTLATSMVRKCTQVVGMVHMGVVSVCQCGCGSEFSHYGCGV